MGRKNSASISDHSFEEQQLTLQQEVQLKIKQLPTLKQKVQAIALDCYILQKRRIDNALGDEVNKIEIEFRKKYQPLLNEINNIVSGTHTYSDADFENQEVLNQEENNLRHNYYKNQEFSEYWFKALISSDVLGEEIRQIDQALLKHLTRIQAVKQTQKNLKVIFTFTQNQWFTNTTLTKQFELNDDEIKRSFGDDINWKEGKNITVKIVKKKGKKGKKTTQKQVESFFNFFKQIDLSTDNEQDKQADQDKVDQQEDGQIAKLERQYEIANELYENLVPKSLEYFLGMVGCGDFGDMEGLDAIGQEQQADQQSEAKPKKAKSKSKQRKGSNASSN